jgi:hypothetical protein
LYDKINLMDKINTKKCLRQLLIFLLLVAFLLNFITGLIKFPEGQRYFIFIYNYISAAKISWLHDYSGLILIGLIIIHLIINRRGIFGWSVPIIKKIKEIKNVKILLLLLLLVVIISIVAYWSVARKSQPVALSAVEINSYQGEKLGSINDFRENSISGPQYIDKNSYRLKITGLVASTTSYSYDDLLRLPAYQKVVTLNCVEGWSVKVLWEGILLKDVLKNLAIKPGANTIIFYAVDGYSTSFPLNYVLNNNIILADKMNGLVLPPERGFPFQLVAEQKWGYKWIKWITQIELSSDTNYQGFWESRGYNNNGDLTGSKFSQ